MPPPCSSERFSENHVPVIVTRPPPSLLKPPPACALFSVNEPPVRTTSPPAFECMPPPSPPSRATVSTAEFLANVELSTVTSPVPSFANPPPVSAVFSLNELFRIVTPPRLLFRMPPPQSTALFFENELSSTSTTPPVLAMAPPHLAAFSENVLSVTVTSPVPL